MSDVSPELGHQASERTIENVSILKRQAMFAHTKVIKETGGSQGVRDEGALDAALAAPFATFYGEDLHPGVFDKAASLMRSLSTNHPFVDGNKRTSLVMTAAFLLERGYGFKESIPDQEMVDFCVEIAKGAAGVAEISSWLSQATDSASGRSFRKVMEKLHDV